MPRHKAYLAYLCLPYGVSYPFRSLAVYMAFCTVCQLVGVLSWKSVCIQRRKTTPGGSKRGSSWQRARLGTLILEKPGGIKVPRECRSSILGHPVRSFSADSAPGSLKPTNTHYLPEWLGYLLYPGADRPVGLSRPKTSVHYRRRSVDYGIWSSSQRCGMISTGSGSKSGVPLCRIISSVGQFSIAFG